ncbi:hypothetical protein N7490_006039 [Penicillium lividum]|nr:hypothetical protein N7490_006039 [Penicillium lividum]
MRPTFVDHDDNGVQQSIALDAWDDTLQYAPAPGTIRRSPAFLSDSSSIIIDPTFLIDHTSPEENDS